MTDPANPGDARQELLDALLDKVADEPYPSATMLDLIESLLQPDEVPLYAGVLLSKVRTETYPSIPMLRRIAALVQ